MLLLSIHIFHSNVNERNFVSCGNKLITSHCEEQITYSKGELATAITLSGQRIDGYYSNLEADLDASSAKRPILSVTCGRDSQH